MAGRFEGLSDLEWHLLVDVFPPEPTPRKGGHTEYLISSGCEDVVVRVDHGLPLVGSPARTALGFEKHRASVAPSRPYKPASSGLLKHTG